MSPFTIRKGGWGATKVLCHNKTNLKCSNQIDIINVNFFIVCHKFQFQCTRSVRRMDDNRLPVPSILSVFSIRVGGKNLSTRVCNGLNHKLIGALFKFVTETKGNLKVRVPRDRVASFVLDVATPFQFRRKPTRSCSFGIHFGVPDKFVGRSPFTIVECIMGDIERRRWGDGNRSGGDG